MTRQKWVISAACQDSGMSSPEQMCACAYLFRFNRNVRMSRSRNSRGPFQWAGGGSGTGLSCCPPSPAGLTDSPGSAVIRVPSVSIRQIHSAFLLLFSHHAEPCQSLLGSNRLCFGARLHSPLAGNSANAGKPSNASINGSILFWINFIHPSSNGFSPGSGVGGEPGAYLIT